MQHIVNAQRYNEINASPERRAAALAFIRTLADFDEHAIDSDSLLFTDVRTVMFYELPVKYVFTGTGIQVYRNAFSPSNEQRLTAALARLKE